MQINTRQLPATDTEGVRIRVHLVGGSSTTVPYPYQANNPHHKVAEDLARGLIGERFVEIKQIGQTPRGYKFEVITKADEERE